MNKHILIVPAALIAVVAGGGLLIDGQIDLATERTLSAPASSIAPLVGTAEGVRRWWSAAPAGAEAMTIAHAGGPQSGPGMVVTFSSGDTVMETWTLDREGPSEVVYRVDFAGLMAVERTIGWTPRGEGAQLTWRETGRIENPVFRWMKVLMPEDDVKKNFDVALGLLEKAARG